MFDWGQFRELKEFYSGAFGESYRFDHDHHHVEVRARDLARVMSILKNDMGFLLLSEIVPLDISAHGLYQQRYLDLKWDVTYHLFHLEAHQRFQVHLLLSTGETLPTITKWYSSAARLEREARARMGGASESQQPLQIPNYRTNPNLSEAPYPEELNQWYLFDLTHPMTRQQWALAVEATDGKILNTWFQGGYWGQNLEKRAPNFSCLNMQPLLDGLFPTATALTNVAWAKTLEDYFLWQIPERAQAVRMIFMELARLSHHLTVLAQIAESLQVDEGHQVCLEARENIRSLLQFYSGARVATKLGYFGGLSHDLPHGWIQEMTQFLKHLDGVIMLYSRMVTQHPLARRRLKHAKISAPEALEAGLTGPVLRASGVNFDLRKSRPFYFYKDIDFQVPVGVRGDSFDRALIYLEECRESQRILWQVLDNLPLGAIKMDQPGIDDFNQGKLDPSLWQEWVRKADRAWSAQYTAVEAAHGELGFHIVLSEETQKLSSLKIKTNAPLLAQALPTFLKGCPVSDLSVALASLNLDAAALDR